MAGTAAIETYHLHADAAQLRALLDRLRPHGFAEPTGFKSWTGDDILRHLLRGNAAAVLALRDPQSLDAMMRRSGCSRREQEVAFARGASGHDLVRAWQDGVEAIAVAFAGIDLTQRVPWAGHSMSARSLLSARLMEQWAHGQAIYDLLGVERIESDAIHAVATLGVNAFAFTFRVNGLPVPEAKPSVVLVAPAGAIWRFGDSNGAISGSAVDFCRVVTQTRNVADTTLDIRGETARNWMALAQCFAGPSHPPPLPGSRRVAIAPRTDLLTSTEGLVFA